MINENVTYKRESLISYLIKDRYNRQFLNLGNYITFFTDVINWCIFNANRRLFDVRIYIDPYITLLDIG